MEENKSTQKILEAAGRKFILIGTAHVSKYSIEEVENAIGEHKPDSVAIELDENRLKNIEDRNSWTKMDIVAILRKKQGFLLLANIVLSAYQKRMGGEAGVKPGDEMAAAIKKARELGIPQVMVDRPVTVTLRRAWAKNSFMGKCKLLSLLFATAFSKEQVSETEIENLKQSSEMDTMMKELSSFLPAVKEVLIDERDFYLASKIWLCPQKKVLAVLGAGHLPGVYAHLEKLSSGEETPDVSEIERVPEKSAAVKIFSWIIPVLILALIVTGFVVGGIEKGADLIGSWALWNGVLAAIGAAAGGGHILAVLSAAVGAPFTSLCPFVGIGFVSGIVQALVKKPSVGDMENLQADSSSIKGFYKNRILRVLLVFFLSSIGSSIGTFIGGASFISIFSR
ncbi:TraB/GumN family protein [Treponema sp.]|uniref:TraB/GumN family protein n=1 Tax=Treponema sp. TaxID=166 RepID=UPI003EFFA1F3